MGRAIPQSLRLQAYLQFSCHKWGECANSCACKSVCFCSRSGGGAGILEGPFEHRIWVLNRKVTAEILGDLCCLTYVAAASKWLWWTLGLCYKVATITWLRQETRTEGRHLKSRGLCGITRSTRGMSKLSSDRLHFARKGHETVALAQSFREHSRRVTLPFTRSSK